MSRKERPGKAPCPIACPGIDRHCAASLAAQYLKSAISDRLALDGSNFRQCAMMSDGASTTAQLLQMYDSIIHHDPENPIVIIETDFQNAFNSYDCHYAFDNISGKATRVYDEGRINVGDSIPTFGALENFSGYFEMIHDTDANLRFTDQYDQTHILKGTQGGQQRDPLEMLRFCLATYPTWDRVLKRHPKTQTVAYADDSYVHGQLRETLLAVADLKRNFENDAALQMQVFKFKIYIKNVSLEHAQHLVRTMIDADQDNLA